MAAVGGVRKVDADDCPRGRLGQAAPWPLPANHNDLDGITSLHRHLVAAQLKLKRDITVGTAMRGIRMLPPSTSTQEHRLVVLGFDVPREPQDACLHCLQCLAPVLTSSFGLEQLIYSILLMRKWIQESKQRSVTGINPPIGAQPQAILLTSHLRCAHKLPPGERHAP